MRQGVSGSWNSSRSAAGHRLLGRRHGRLRRRAVAGAAAGSEAGDPGRGRAAAAGPAGADVRHSHRGADSDPAGRSGAGGVSRRQRLPTLRDDPLFKTIAEVDPRHEQSLASGSTINRFQHADTRREAEKPVEEREVLCEVRRA